MDHQHEDEEDYSRLALLLPPAPAPQALESAPLPGPGPKPILKRRGKKRSSRACMTCRARKVRCNIVAHGPPCSNCRHDEVECIVPLSRRQRSAREREESMRKAADGSATGQSRLNTSERDSSEKCRDSRSMSRQDTHPGAPTLLESGQISPVLDSHTHITAPHGMRISEHVLSEVIPTRSISPCNIRSASLFPRRTKSWSQIQLPLASAPVADGPESLKLPCIFASFPSHLDAADLSYLKMRDALTIPSEEMQIQLLRAYVDFVHGSMPLLDLDEFMTLVKYGRGGETDWKENGRGIGGDSPQQISFLLFQAVMFAASGFLSMRVLREEGYRTREIAQKAFFNRVRLLYDFDTCTDRLPIIQSLLLMTHCPSPSFSDSDQKDAYYYLGLAISLCYTLGLHRSSEIFTPHTSLSKRKLEKRIWWVCFTRDRTLALGANGEWARPVRIRREDCDVEMLNLEDFELYDGVEEGEGVEERRARLEARHFVERAMLCWCSSDMLLSQYVATNPYPLPTPPLLLPQPAFPFAAEHSQHHFEDEFHYHSHTSPEECSFSDIHESTLSPSEDCITPRYETEMEVAERYEDNLCGMLPEKVGLAYSEEDLKRGYGVNKEYDDYLEYFKVGDLAPVGAKRETESEKGSWAIQLDCEKGEIIEV